MQTEAISAALHSSRTRPTHSINRASQQRFSYYRTRLLWYSMSYDLTFKRGKSTPLTPKKRDALAAALCKIHRPFKQSKFDFAHIAKQLKITEAAARKQFSMCELTEMKSGLQIIIDSKEASLAIPYSLKAKKAKQVFGIVAELGAKLTESGFTCKDPQLNRKVNFAKDIDAMLECYSSTSNAVNELTDEDFAAIIQEAIAKTDKKK